jgi:hypothetical protein
VKTAIDSAREVPDINVLASLLKLYFRELPEALFTDALYSKLNEGISALQNNVYIHSLLAAVSDLISALYEIFFLCY